MSNPTFEVQVDVTNPGQFFACCGLLELADRLWPGAEGWFSITARRFHVAAQGTLVELMERFAESTISSSLSPDELKRLGRLLSISKASLSEDDLADKERLQQAWRNERLYITPPFGLWLDWWRDARGDRTELKTWAAKQMVFEMATAMLASIRRDTKEHGPWDGTAFSALQDDSLPFNFDSDLSRAGNARDAGFSPDTLGIKASYRPLLELLAFIGLQRCRPQLTDEQDCLSYAAWQVPLPAPIIGAATAGCLELPSSVVYHFELFRRTKYMKSFLPAQSRARSPINE